MLHYFEGEELASAGTGSDCVPSSSVILRKKSLLMKPLGLYSRIYNDTSQQKGLPIGHCNKGGKLVQSPLIEQQNSRQ